MRILKKITPIGMPKKRMMTTILIPMVIFKLKKSQLLLNYFLCTEEADETAEKVEAGESKSYSFNFVSKLLKTFYLQLNHLHEARSENTKEMRVIKCN